MYIAISCNFRLYTVNYVLDFPFFLYYSIYYFFSRLISKFLLDFQSTSSNPRLNKASFIPRIIGRAIIIFFALTGGDNLREGDNLMEAIIVNIAHWKLCPKYFVLLFH